MRLRPTCRSPQRDRGGGPTVAHCSSVPSRRSSQALDKNAGSRFDPVRIATDVPGDLARVITEESRDLPGVEVTVEERREYEYGPLVVARHWLHRRRDRQTISTELATTGYLDDDMIGQRRRRGDLRGRSCAARTASSKSSATRPAALCAACGSSSSHRTATRSS